MTGTLALLHRIRRYSGGAGKRAGRGGGRVPIGLSIIKRAPGRMIFPRRYDIAASCNRVIDRPRSRLACHRETASRAVFGNLGVSKKDARKSPTGLASALSDSSWPRVFLDLSARERVVGRYLDRPDRVPLTLSASAQGNIPGGSPEDAPRLVVELQIS